MNIGSNVSILNLKGNKKGKVVGIFKHGDIIYYRVLYQNLGDNFLHTTTENNLKEI